nr:YkgJ family cysteine cluster protein [Endozoicomonas atrinae]
MSLDKWGAETMLRLAGWCSALYPNTYMCSIYEKRPLIYREFEMNYYEFNSEKVEYMAISR